MKKLFENNKGFTLVELIIALAVVSIAGTMFASAMISSHKVVENAQKRSEVRESSVGNMDSKFNNSSVTGTDLELDVVFPASIGTEKVECYKIMEDSSTNYHIGIVKPKS